MAVRSRDFVRIAEGIRSHELSAKNLIENLKGRVSELSSSKRTLESTISCLEAEIAAAYEDTDEDGNPDYTRISALEGEKIQAENELWDVETDLDSTSYELENKENELAAVEEEKEQALFEIQERARKTAQNISLAGGMYGAYASTGSVLQNSFKVSLSALTQAASILGGSVSGASGGSGGSHASGRTRGTASGESISLTAEMNKTGPLSAFLGSTDTSLSLQAGKFHTAQDQFLTPASMANFHSDQKTVRAKEVQNFTSAQTTETINAFCTPEEESIVLPGVETYLTRQESSLAVQTKSSSVQTPQTPVQKIAEAKAVPPVVRSGRNAFLDSLIVQDWEMGRYSDPAGPGRRKEAARSDYERYTRNPNRYQHVSYSTVQKTYIDPAAIQQIRGMDDPNFWSYKTTSYSDYINMARQIPVVSARLRAGEKLTELAQRKDVIGACARNYFLKDDITVTRVGNAYLFGDEGRHRAMAALIAGVPLPVRVTDEWKENTSEVSENRDRAAQFRKAFAEKSAIVSQKIQQAGKKELENLVKTERIAGNVDFGEMDIRVAREWVETIWDVKNQYSFLDFPFIGATQSFQRKLRRNIQSSLEALYQQNQPMDSVEDVRAQAEMETIEYMKKFEIKPGDLAVSISVKKPDKIKRPKPGLERGGNITMYLGDTLSSGFNGITMNLDQAENYETLMDTLRKEEMNGASPRGCNSVRYLALHEIAHQLDEILQLSLDSEIVAEYERYKKQSEKDQIRELGTYAATDIKEFVAEAWAESQCSASPRRIAEMIAWKVDTAAKKYADSKKEDESYVRERER